jgi:hypothetical protein
LPLEAEEEAGRLPCQPRQNRPQTGLLPSALVEEQAAEEEEVGVAEEAARELGPLDAEQTQQAVHLHVLDLSPPMSVQIEESQPAQAMQGEDRRHQRRQKARQTATGRPHQGATRLVTPPLRR